MESSDDDRRSGTPERKKKVRGDSNLKSSHRAQKYRLAWESDDQFKGWLASVRGNSHKARCNLCGNEFNAELSIIKRHRETEKHKKLTSKLGYASKQKKLLECFKNNAPPNPLAKQIKIAEIRTCAFLCEGNHALRCVDYLIRRDKAVFPDSKIAQSMALGRTKATSIIKNVLGKAHSNELAQMLRTHKFSVLIDESTDVGTIKSLAICIRLFSDSSNRVVDYFWKMVQIFSPQDPDAANEGATSERLFDALIKTFRESEVPMENMIGFGADNCSSMMGVNNSVASRLKIVLPGITIQGCVCHSLHLCASEACKKLPRKPEDLARQIYGYFKNSSKRQAQFREFQDFCNVDPHKILKPSQTRWLSLLQVVRRILEQWEPLKLFFTSHQHDARTARPMIADKTSSLDTIVDAMNDPQVKLYYYFLEYCLPKFITLNELFQSERSLITAVYGEVSSTYKELLSCYMDKRYILQNELENINPEVLTNESAHLIPINGIYLGVKVLQEFSKPNITKHQGLELEVRTRCRDFLATACKELKKRFNFSVDSPYAKMSVLQAKEVLSTSPSRCQSLLPLAQMVPRIVSPDDLETLQNIDDQWRRIGLTSFPELKHTDSPEKVWFCIKNFTDINGRNEFKDVANFALNVLSLPHSSASCERIFSKINLAKTKIRNKLATETINGLLLSSQCATIGGGSHSFPVTDEMLSRMTTDSLYPSTSSKRCADEEENEVEFEMSDF